VRRSGGEFETAFGELHGARTAQVDDVLERAGSVAVELANSFREPVSGIREIGARVIGREEHRSADPGRRRRRTSRVPLRVVGVLVGTVGAERPTGDSRAGRDQQRPLEL
jgi:hypothetical protein